MTYIKRQNISKTWPIMRKGTKYVVMPSHAKKQGIPLLIIMRDILEFVKTRKELKKIIYEEKVLVNGKIVREENLALVLFDNLSLPLLKKNYKLTLGENKKIKLDEIKGIEAGKKISKVIGKKILKGNKTQINLLDGRNLLTDEKIKVGDSVLVKIADKKIEKVLPIKEKSEILVIRGKHIGKIGKIEKVEEDEIIFGFGKDKIKIKEEEIIVLS